MQISFSNKKLQKQFESEKALKKAYGAQMARKIQMRMAVLKNAPSLKEVPHTPPDRRHQLTGNRSGQFAVDLQHPHRLIFSPDHDEIPTDDDGSIRLDEVKAIQIIEVADYH